MVWEKVKSGGKSVAGFNHWPAPANWIKQIRTLACNQESFTFQIDFAFPIAAHYFWSNLLPSPREVERKFFLGGYRCGFYIDVKVKSPLEVIWGAKTARVIAEIARPFVTPLFYFWVVTSTVEALASWQTLLYPQLVCTPSLGDGQRRDDIAPLGAGETHGVPGLGTWQYDFKGFMSLTTASVTLPPGYWHVYAAWLVEGCQGGIDSVSVGLLVNGVPTNMSEGAPVLPFGQSFVINEKSGYSASGAEVSAYIEAQRPPGVIPCFAYCHLFIYDWSPIPDVPWWNPLQDGHESALPHLPALPNCYGEY